MGGSSGGGGGQTVTSSTAIPDWQQGMVQSNENIAQGLASQPYPTYQGQLIAGFSPLQQQGMNMTTNSAGSFQPYQDAARGMTNQAAEQWSPQAAQQYMSPYAMAALQPQIQALQTNQGLQANQLNASATQAGAFGDARQGAQQSLDNFYNNLSMNDLVGQGMNSAYNSGLGAFGQGQQQLLNAGNQMGQLGSQQQGLGLQGANAVFNAGTQQQQLQQQQLTESYQNFMNQVNWPYQQLNARIAATANSPYQVPTANLAPNSATAQNLGAFAAAAGGIGSLLGGGGSSNSGGGSNVYGGMPSDIRLKKNIRRVGHTPKGIPVYDFHYIWDNDDDPIRTGCMAHEVREVVPEAVSSHDGYLMVNYDKVQ